MCKKLLNILIVIFLCTFFGCTQTSTHTNRPKDKNDATVITNKFYNHLKEKNYTDIFNLFSNGSGKINIQERDKKLKAIFDLAYKELGAIKTVKVLKCETKVTEGAKHSGEYRISYLVIRDKVSVPENFKLLIENDTIKIIDYKIEI